MRKVNEITNVRNLDNYKNLVIVWDNKGIQQINEEFELISLVEGNIHSLKIVDNELLYQLNDSYNIYIYNKDIRIKDDFGYTLHSALRCSSYIYIYWGKDNTSIFMDSSLLYVKKAPEYCFASYKDYLFDYNKNTIICYQINNKLWCYEHSDDSKIHIISGYQDKILIYSESGDLFALNLNDGNICWKYPEKCLSLHSLAGDNLYSLNKNELIEVNAATGEKQRQVDIRTIEEKEKFSINRIKAYDDFIFCTDTFGTIAVIDRESLKINDILRFDHHLINRDYTLQWVNNRLYVQDAEYTIHVFE